MWKNARFCGVDTFYRGLAWWEADGDGGGGDDGGEEGPGAGLVGTSEMVRENAAPPGRGVGGLPGASPGIELPHKYKCAVKFCGYILLYFILWAVLIHEFS